MKLTKCQSNKMISHSEREYPNECCGILAGNTDGISEIFPITNTAKSPFRYLMDPQEQLTTMLEIEKQNWDIKAFYHSHTHSQAYPSATDVRMALESGWLDVQYVLISLEDRNQPLIRAFQINESGDILELSVEIANP